MQAATAAESLACPRAPQRTGSGSCCRAPTAARHGQTAKPRFIQQDKRGGWGCLSWRIHSCCLNSKISRSRWCCEQHTTAIWKVERRGRHWKTARAALDVVSAQVSMSPGASRLVGCSYVKIVAVADDHRPTVFPLLALVGEAQQKTITIRGIRQPHILRHGTRPSW